MDDLPTELHARRDAIYDRVTKQGRTRRRRRSAAVVAVVAAVLAIPITAVALNATPDDPRVRVSSTPTTGRTTTSGTDPTSTSETTATGNASCHNSRNPACGPIRYEPPLTNDPAPHDH